MPRRTKADAEKTRKKILASALSLFAKNGYEHTTFNDIAQRLRMTKGAVYWHFKSKDALLIALVNEMLESFRREILSLLPEGETSFDKLSFPDVAGMMVRHAVRTVSDPKRSAFFILIHERISWTSTSMEKVREDLLKGKKSGPWEAFQAAIENDIKSGRVKDSVNPKEVASCCLALWDGLTRSHIARFLECDLAETLERAYAAIWRDISEQQGVNL